MLKNCSLLLLIFEDDGESRLEKYLNKKLAIQFKIIREKKYVSFVSVPK